MKSIMKSRLLKFVITLVSAVAVLAAVLPPAAATVGAAAFALATPDYFGTTPNWANSPLPIISTPTVTFSGGNGTGAAATATVATGVVNTITVTAGGTGYYGAPEIVISGGGGTGAKAKASVTAGVITGIAVTAGGAGYTSAPTVTIASGTGATATATVSGGTVTTIGVVAGGSGYNLPPAVTITGVGSEATALARVAGGVVTGITVTNGGSGYTTAPSVAVASPGTGAAATAAIVGRVVTGFTITNGGSGYTFAPTVSITGGGGTGAIATAIVTAGAVTAITLNNGGSGYGSIAGSGIRKFVDTIAGLGAAGANNLGQYVSVAVPDTITYPGTDYYVIAARQYTEKMHSDLPASSLRGYVQLNNGTDATTHLNTVAPSPIHYLGPAIVAQTNRPVRILFINQLPLQASGGDIFLPVDVTIMGAGTGPNGGSEVYTDNRATIHLHGGVTGWVSDGTTHQWTTPAGEITSYKQGVSVQNVPDMPIPPNGSITFYYTNQQSARLMFYHDHAYGITRLNVYDGVAAAYVLTDPVEQALVNGGTFGGITVAAGTIPANQIPLVIQDKTFVPPTAQLTAEDPTWDSTKYGGFGNLWFPHVYMPNQNPWDIAGVAAMGRWDYGPWFWPPFTGLQNGPLPNPLYPAVAGEPPLNPGLPNPSLTPEAFMDTPLVNGTVYPVLNLEPKAYRFRILNACNDRALNLQLYYAKSNGQMWNPDGTLNDPNAGEINMVSAAPDTGLPASWPTDGRAGGVPDPNAVGPSWIQIGTEGGFLPAVTVIPSVPIGYEYNRRNIVVLNVTNRSLYIGPAERADVVVDFSNVPPGTNLILYNDAPAPVPAFDTRVDYYTGDPDQTDSGGAPSTLPGYGPNTRTIMQIHVAGTPAASYNVAAIQAALPVAYRVTQPPPIVPQAAYNAAFNANYPADAFVRIADNFISFFNGPLTGITLSNGGSGYTLAPSVTISGGGGTGATATAILANGAVRAITVTAPGSGYMAPPDITFSGGGGTGAVATAKISNGIVYGVVINDGGSGYVTAPTITFSGGGGGTGAAATATIDNGVVRAITLTNQGTGYTSAPVVALSGGGGAGAAAAATGVTLDMKPKAIQELFTVDYGRMNATLGVELPFTTMTLQTTIPLGYIDPTTEIIQDSSGAAYIGAAGDGTQIWKITHNGVDTHFIHFHLFNVQVINRVGWDGQITPPDANEVGWKDTVRMNPLEDIIVALRAATPTMPFGLPVSIRPMDTTKPIGSTMGFANIDPATGNPITVTNQLVNFGWEYVWHCHILGHEENDMMRPIEFDVPAVVPPAPILSATSTGGVNALSWLDGTPFNYSTWLPTSTIGNPANEVGFLIERARVTGGTPGPYTQIGTAPANTTTFADMTALGGVSYRYYVVAYNAAGSANSNTAEATPAVTTALIGTGDVPMLGNDGSDNFILDRYIAQASGNVTSIRVKVGAVGNVKVAIYADNAGQPGALLNAVNTSTPIVAGWNNIPITSTAVTQGTAYWLGFNTDTPCILFTASGGTGLYKPGVAFAGFSFPSPGGTGFYTWSGFHTIAGWGTMTSATPPAVTNGSGATLITTTSASLNGVLSGGAANVTIYWGPTDGGTTPANWANSIAMGTMSAGAFSWNITGLTPGVTYYYRCFAQNPGGPAWAATSSSFTANQVKLIGTGDVPMLGNDGSNNFILDRYVAQVTGNVVNIWVKVGAVGNVKVAIYADNAGQPGALLNAVNSSTPVVPGWNVIPMPSTSVTQGTAYWLGFNTDTPCILFTATGGTGLYKPGTAFAGFTFPTPAGTGFNPWAGYHTIAGWGF